MPPCITGTRAVKLPIFKGFTFTILSLSDGKRQLRLRHQFSIHISLCRAHADGPFDFNNLRLQRQHIAGNYLSFKLRIVDRRKISGLSLKLRLA